MSADSTTASTASGDGAQSAGPGRPRQPDVDASIHQAVVDVLAEQGYHRLSYEQVATAAGVSRPTLYRRAPNKAALVVRVLVERYGLVPVPDTGSVETDLLALQQAQLELYNDPVIGSTLPGLLGDIRDSDAARTAWVDGFVRPRRDGVAAAVQRAVRRGELCEDTDAEWVCEILTGPLVSAAFLTGPHRLPASMTTETVSLVLRRYGANHDRPDAPRPPRT